MTVSLLIGQVNFHSLLVMMVAVLSFVGLYLCTNAILEIESLQLPSKSSVHYHSKLISASHRDAPLEALRKAASTLFISTCFVLTSSVASVPFFPLQSASAVESSNTEKVYFGLGCFWHVQHEMAIAEKNILGRADDQLTVAAGYAGGSKVFKNKEGKDLVCYHNMQGVGEYGIHRPPPSNLD